MFPSRPARAALGAATAVLLLAGCGDSGGLVSAGSTPTASGPTRLWPDQPPASSPAYYGEAQKEAIKGIRAAGDDIHKVDPVTVVRAEIAAHPEYYGTDGPYHETARAMSACGAGASRGGRCPVLEAYYRDLTGDGRDDMTLAFRLRPGNQTAVRVYTFEADRLVQVLANDDAVTGVELAGRKVIIRSPAGIVGYEYRTQWTWDAEQLAMLLTRDEILRVGASRGAVPPKPSHSSSPSSTGSAR